MEKSRLEAFSDGVIAIILTIMVLDLKVPKEHTFEALAEAWPVFGAYALSYWNVFLLWLNHHDIFAQLKQVNRPLLLANGLLLFVASLIPFATAFASEAHWTRSAPVTLYGLVMGCVSAAFFHLQRVAWPTTAPDFLGNRHRAEARIFVYLGVAFLCGALAAWFAPRWALLIYAAVPLLRVFHRRRLDTDTHPAD
jgi:uncharacterized membrane protein